jgi:hypothetical protein
VCQRLAGQHQPQGAHHHLGALAVSAEVELAGVHQDQPHQFGDALRNRFVVAQERVGEQESRGGVSDRLVADQAHLFDAKADINGGPWNGVAHVPEA